MQWKKNKLNIFQKKNKIFRRDKKFNKIKNI